MGNLSEALGGAFTPPVQVAPEPPEVQLRDAIRQAGLTPPDHIVMDGEIHRFNVDSRRDRSGWYVAFGGPHPAGAFGCWRTDIDAKWSAASDRELTVAEQMAQARQMDEARKKRDKERREGWAQASNSATDIWKNAEPAPADHPYLVAKGIQPHDMKIASDGRLIVPMLSPEVGGISSLQYIDDTGRKLMMRGGKAGGAVWRLGNWNNPATICIAEGFATAASIVEVTGYPCMIAFSAHNLPAAAEYAAKAFPSARLVIVADNDESGTGLRYADRASEATGATVVMPPDIDTDANDYHLAGGDLAALLAPPDDGGWLIQADDFSSQPAPIKWLVKHWLQDSAMIMVHGPSGAGKTFVVLDMVLRMAGDVDDWMGNRTSPGTVVYLAGEGHHGLRGRIAGWKQHNQVEHLDMWLSRSGCDLNTPAGYTQAIEAIRSLPDGKQPAIIVVDTLHRFLHGDENSAQDTKTMLDACAGLMQEFNCTVLLVHHTGVSDEAQHRARGSSAWRAALDIEINITPGKDDGPMTIRQVKAKDSEEADDLHATLESVAIKGWLDEDGEQVTTAVLEPAGAPTSAPSAGERNLGRFRTYFERAWYEAGSAIEDGKPYLTKQGLYAWAHKNMNETGWRTDNSINTNIGLSKSHAMGKLIEAGIISPHLDGYILIQSDIGAGLINQLEANRAHMEAERKNGSKP